MIHICLLRDKSKPAEVLKRMRLSHLLVVVISLVLSSLPGACAEPNHSFQLNPKVENKNNAAAEEDTSKKDSSKKLAEPSPSPSDEVEETSKKEPSDAVKKEDSDDLILENPDFSPDDSDDDSSSDSSDSESDEEDELEGEVSDDEEEDSDIDEYDEDDEEEDDLPAPKLSDIKAVKKSLDSALAKSSKRTKKYVKLAKKHKATISVAITVIAFRREILKTFHYFWRKQFVDPVTGKFDWKKIKPMTLLKLYLIVDALRKVYLFRNPPDSEEGKYSAENHVKLIIALSTNYPALAMLLTNFAPRPMYNPSYVPPIDQHWMFERINERYVKDGLALSKAMKLSHEKLKWYVMNLSVDYMLFFAMNEREHLTLSFGSCTKLLLQAIVGQLSHGKSGYLQWYQYSVCKHC